MAFLVQQRARKSKHHSGRMSEINITPFVDVMLVLLVVFMVTAPLLTTGMELDLPEGNNSAISGADKAIDISVDEKGRI